MLRQVVVDVRLSIMLDHFVASMSPVVTPGVLGIRQVPQGLVVRGWDRSNGEGGERRRDNGVSTPWLC